VGHVAHHDLQHHEGVKNGFERKLEINGVGYRAAMQGKNIQLSLGFSHEVVYQVPDGHSAATPEADGNRSERHRQAAARPGRRGDPQVSRPPEPYKGKGVKYAEETIVRKEGKKK
jgi:large subunit ribosomal protein L6